MNDLFEKIRDGHLLTGELREEVRIQYGNRGIKALAATDERRVMKYLDFFVVKGSTSEYIVEEDFCTCGDFLFRGRECWHLLAVRLAVAAGLVVSIPDWYQEHLNIHRSGQR